MTSKFTELVIDCRDPRRLAEFWSQVLDYQITDEDDHGVEIAGPHPPTLLFGIVPEGKAVKNRLHIDVNAVDRSQEDEVERIVALGATLLDIGQGEVSWVVLADPEGNEFCVLKSRVEP